MSEVVNSLFKFIKESKTPYHAVGEIAKRLDKEGFVRLFENEEWELLCGGKYYVIRSDASLIAFKNNGGGFMICASHSDSPAFKVKSDIKSGAYVRLDTEKYGGMAYYTWIDRPLGVAGRATVKTEDGFLTRKISLDFKTVIPSLAIHMNREVNNGLKLNPASDMLALAGLDTEKLRSLVARAADCTVEELISYDLYLYCDEEPFTAGYDGELIVAPRLDDLACVYASLEAFLSSENECATQVLAVFDNEEVGSETNHGAASTFLHDTLLRISVSERDFALRKSESFMISADNAHAQHPAHPELSDRENAPTLAGGVVVKYNANQRYTTDAVSDALFRKICKDVKLQSFYNRADMVGGSTLGSISNTKVSIPTVDIGIPQLAMHSATETAAVADLIEMISALKAFFASSVKPVKDEYKIVSK